MSTCRQAIRARRKSRIDPRYQAHRSRKREFKGHVQAKKKA
ncbi:hypothetical protein [Azospirillum brasilense]|nr:hypothetical protein [Azospirillum brasilense]